MSGRVVRWAQGSMIAWTVGVQLLAATSSFAQAPYVIRQLTSLSFNHSWPSINDKGDIVWSEVGGNGLWQVYKCVSPCLMDSEKPIQVPNSKHDFQYPVVDNAGDVVYLEDGEGDGPGLSVVKNVSGVESTIEFSSGSPPGCTEPPAGPGTCTSYRGAGPYFGISRGRGTIISYHDFWGGQQGIRTFDVTTPSGESPLQGTNGQPLNLIHYFDPDINDSGDLAFVYNHQVYRTNVSNKNISDPTQIGSPIGSGDLPRIANEGFGNNQPGHNAGQEAEVVYVSNGEIISTVGGEIDSGIWASVNNVGMIVYERVDESGNSQIFLATPYWQQCHTQSGSEHWGQEEYAFTFATGKPRMMCDKGCATTALSRALELLGVHKLELIEGENDNDPGYLNEFMMDMGVGRDYSAPDLPEKQANNVLPDETTHDASGGVLGFKKFGIKDSPEDPNTLEDILTDAVDYDCGFVASGCPVIVGVASRTHPKSFPGHYILAIGEVSGTTINGACATWTTQANGCVDFLIEDPYGNPSDPTTCSNNKPPCAPYTLLSQYGQKFSIWGYPHDPNDNSAFDLAVGQNGNLLLVDAAGNRTGFDPSTGTVVNEIPGSSYSSTFIDDDTDPNEPATEPSNLLDVFQPTPGVYTITVSRAQTGPYSLSIRGFSSDGSSQPPITLNGTTAPGVTATYQTTYSPTPAGANLSLTLDPAGVPGGKPSTGTVKLSSPAPAGGALVSLASSNAGVATVPASITVAAGATSATFSVTTMAVATATTVAITATYDGSSAIYALTVEALTLSQSSWSFGTQVVGTSSAPDMVTVANSGTGPITISSITVAGGNSDDFTQGNNCPISPATLATGASCVITATFNPTVAGPRQSWISVSDSAENSPQIVILTGVGTVPVIVAIAPVTGSQGQTLANVIITGQYTHFLQGTTTCTFGPGITVNSLTVNSPTSATANITIASSATPGSQTVTLTTGSEVASLLNGFIITAPVTGLPNLIWLGGGHTGGVSSVGAAPDGTVWSAGGDNTIKQWNAANMNMLRTFPLAQTGGAAFAGNGQEALLIDSSGAQAVSLADGSVSRTFPSGDLRDNYLPTISANGQTVAFGRSYWRDDFLVFANGQGPETDIVASFDDPTDGPVGDVGAVAVSADGQYVAATLAADLQVPGTIRLYRVSDGTLVRLLTYNTTSVQALAFSPDGTELASSSADGKINVLRLSDLVVVSSISVFESGNPVSGTALAFSPDGTEIAEGDKYAARIYHLPDGTLQGRIPGATAAVAFTPDGQWLVVGGGQDIRLWLTATLAPLPTVATHSGNITAVAYSPRHDLVASASTDQTVKLRSAVDGTLIASLTGHTDSVNALAFSPDGDMLATGSSDHTIRIWRTSDFTLLNTLTGHTQAVQALAFSPDGSLLASGSSAPEQVVKLWSVGGTWSNICTLTGTGGSVTSVQFSPDGQSVAGASDEGVVRLWQVSTCALSQTYLAPTQGGLSLAFSPDGQLLIAGWGQNILVFQGTATAPVHTVPAHSETGTVVAYSPDGQRVLSGNPDGTLKVWNPAGWGLVTSYNRETDAGGLGVTSVAYSPDSTRFVYGRGDATIGVASTGSTAIPATVTVTTNPPGLAFSVDGTAYTMPHTFSWTPGASHSVSVASPQGSGGTRYGFADWSDGGAPSHTITPVESRIYTATFVTQYLLTEQIIPSGAGNVVASPSSPDGYYATGTVVQLTETPARGWVFSSWSGDASGTTSKVTVSMSQPRSVTATFVTTASADIAVAMSSSLSQINSGKPLSFAVTVTNLGPAESGAMTLIVNLPAAYSLVSASSSVGSCTGTVQVSCPLGKIADAAAVTASIDVTPIATGSIPLTASVDGGTADPNPANNSATVTVKVLPAGEPPILWMGGGVDANAFDIRTTADGTFWTSGLEEIIQWRLSDMRILQTAAPGITSVGREPWYSVGWYAVTGDGKYYAYALGGSVGVYRTSDNSSIATFSGSYSVSISDDGQSVAFMPGCYGGAIIGHVNDGSTVPVPAPVCAAGVALSPDGKWLAETDGTAIDLYRASDGSYVRSLAGFSYGVSELMWAGDSNLLVGSSLLEIIVFDVSQFLQVQNIPLQSGWWGASAISRDGKYFAYGSGGEGGPAAQVWSVADGSVVTTVPSTYATVYGMNFTPDDRWLVIDNGRLDLFAIPQGTPWQYPPANVGFDAAIAYSPAGNRIVTAGNDSIMSVWDSVAGTVVAQVPVTISNPITGVAFSPDGLKLAAGLDNNVAVWSTSNYGLAATLTGHTAPVTAVAFSPDGTLLASASASPEQVVNLWSTQTWSLFRTLKGASNALRSVQFSPDGTKVAASGDDGIAREWNVATGHIVCSCVATGEGAMRIQYSPDGTKLAAGWTGKVLVFDSGTCALTEPPLNAHTQNNTSVAWSPDGKRLISGNPDGTVDVWDTETWGQLSQYNTETYAQNGGVLTVAYSPDNSQFAYGRADAIMVVVDSGSAPTGTLTTVTTDPQGLDLVIDGATLASPQTFRWAAGTTHSIGVPSPQGGSGTKNVFANWSDGLSQNHKITTPSTGATYTATFTPQYLLTPAVSPGAAGSILISPTSTDGYYDSGTAVQAVATANLGYVFGTWSGDATGTENPASVMITAPRNITAYYFALPTAIVSTNPPGLLLIVDGTQYTAPQSFNWIAGSKHKIAVSSEQGSRAERYKFAKWSDGGAASHTITAPGVSTTYTANLNTQYPLITNSNPAGGGTITASPISGDGYYNSGSKVQLTAKSATGYRFASWSGDVSGTTNPQSVTMSAARSVTANFAGLPAVTASPAGLSFVNQLVHTASAAQTETITNTGFGPLTISGISISGGNDVDFSLTHTCPSTLSASASCVINPVFKPTASGPRKSSILVTDNAAGSPHRVILTGVGTAVSLSTAGLTFTSQTVGTKSSAQAVSITNKGSTTMNLWQIAIGGANPGDFSKTTTCGATLGGGATCTVSVTFKPVAKGARSATLLFSDDGGGSPQAVRLTGTGVAAASVTISPSALSFGAQPVGLWSAAQAAVLTNTGQVPLEIGRIAVTGSSQEFLETNTCAATVGPGATCTVKVTFRPLRSGLHAAELVVPHSGTGPTRVELSGAGSLR
ncbi:MAG: choice-of-anchor D domain-containing protein [Terriglobia bacterium]